jgi:hypothetical protein
MAQQRNFLLAYIPPAPAQAHLRALPRWLRDSLKSRGTGFANRKTQWRAFKRKSSLVEYQPGGNQPVYKRKAGREPGYLATVRECANYLTT